MEGDRLITGYNKHIRIFDTSRPGRDCVCIPTVYKHRRQKLGQFGLISCFAACPDPNFLDVFAAGSYSGSIGLYSEKAGSCTDILGDNYGSGITWVGVILGRLLYGFVLTLVPL